MKVKLGNVKGPRGKSAYEIAVENGFEGTEAEWLDSLNGNSADSGIFSCTYNKAGKNHALTASVSSAQILKFKAEAPYEDGDTISLNGQAMTAKTQDGEALSGGAWAAGAVVMCFVSGNLLFFRGGGGGSNKSMIIVDAPSGSAVTCSNGTVSKPGVIKDGKWVFKGCDIGIWTITATHPDEKQPATAKVDITEDCQLVRYYISIAFRTMFDFTYTGDHEIVDDSDNPIADFGRWDGNWKIRFLTSGVLVFTDLRGWDGKLDLFLVGAGGGGCNNESGGAGGGYTDTKLNITVAVNTPYQIDIGSGGNHGGEDTGADGGKTIAFGASVDGGKGAKGYRAKDNAMSGGNGGSGGAGGKRHNAGGRDGSDGSNAEYGSGPKGSGQHRTTREFGEANGKLYANGGDAISSSDPQVTVNGDPNTGDGGNGIYSVQVPGGIGGSGIAIIRNAREEAA